MQFRAEINPSIPIGGFHAGSLNPNRDEDMPEKQIGGDCNEADPYQETGCQSRKKELANFAFGSQYVVCLPVQIKLFIL